MQPEMAFFIVPDCKIAYSIDDNLIVATQEQFFSLFKSKLLTDLDLQSSPN
jgi:hypothetical protein